MPLKIERKKLNAHQHGLHIGYGDPDCEETHQPSKNVRVTSLPCNCLI